MVLEYLIGVSTEFQHKENVQTQVVLYLPIMLMYAIHWELIIQKSNSLTLHQRNKLSLV